MKNLLLLLLLLLPLTGCLDDDDGMETLQDAELTIAFRAEYGGEPLHIQSEAYGYPTGDSLKLLLFQYYLSDLALNDGSGRRQYLLSDIDLIRWNSATDDPTQERTYTVSVPVGTYQGLTFGLGVKPTLNATDPSNFPADYVLNENEFWGPTTRYVFAKIEANAQLEEDGRYDTGLSYHMGSDSLYRGVQLDRSFTITDGSSPHLTIVVDVRNALSSNGQTLDITDPTKQAVHGGNQQVASGVWHRLSRSFRLEVN
ncbi:MbnP family protein [Lewinella sp. IMCC34183]|uniref:MbnP family protein n=1 Tax=Lewinella sp. IMCC34183 TaxID=2248762 RepID=UPI000E26FCCC|nr:MbnP family protein [Lewinella sp. IMCC34183]